jgi:hypothetical protein
MESTGKTKDWDICFGPFPWNVIETPGRNRIKSMKEVESIRLFTHQMGDKKRKHKHLDGLKKIKLKRVNCWTSVK